MRRAVVLLAVALWLTPARVAAVEAWQFDEGALAVHDHQPGDAGAPGGGGDGVSAGGGVGRSWFAYWTIGWTGDRFCRQRRVTTDPALADAYNFAFHRQFAGGNAAGNADLCPANVAVTPVLVPTPDQVARDFWDVRLLPAPTLRVVPDYAITGKPVYLEIEGDLSRHFDVPDPLGPPIAIDATSHYVVDWGDGTVQRTTSHGGPWPDGDLTHVYTTSHPGRVLRVTQEWSAAWRAGDQQGTLDMLQTQGGLTLPVTQVQAVRS
ncbi:MAG: hypothetical protein QOK43_2859 [Acidimicrobiaceae bacterium]|nr:hypothetical protein [Acidimicrobiaceae bacterium]